MVGVFQDYLREKAKEKKSYTYMDQMKSIITYSYYLVMLIWQDFYKYVYSTWIDLESSLTYVTV